ncbi:hypothetical protein D3C77_621640 [compost metagenome]
MRLALAVAKTEHTHAPLFHRFGIALAVATAQGAAVGELAEAMAHHIAFKGHFGAQQRAVGPQLLQYMFAGSHDRGQGLRLALTPALVNPRGHLRVFFFPQRQRLRAVDPIKLAGQRSALARGEKLHQQGLLRQQ